MLLLLHVSVTTRFRQVKKRPQCLAQCCSDGSSTALLVLLARCCLRTVAVPLLVRSVFLSLTPHAVNAAQKFALLAAISPSAIGMDVRDNSSVFVHQVQGASWSPQIAQSNYRLPTTCASLVACISGALLPQASASA